MPDSAKLFIGDNIQSLRKEKKLSIEEASIQSGIKKEIFTAIENNTHPPSIADLLKLTSLYDTSIGHIILGKESKNEKMIIIKSADRIAIDPAKANSSSYRYESLAMGLKNRHMEPFLVDIYPEEKNQSESSSHPGEEFHFVLDGEIVLHIEKETHHLVAGDAIYFNSSLSHRVYSKNGTAKILAVLYKLPKNNFTAKPVTRSRKMENIIEAARYIKNMNLGMVCPDVSSMFAINRALEENILEKAYLVGCSSNIHRMVKRTIRDKSRVVIFDDFQLENDRDEEKEQKAAALRGVQLAKEGKIQMLMKGNINTATFTRPVTNPRNGIGTGRRLSLVCTFDLPNIDRLIFLTDPGINPSLLRHEKPESARDIIENAVNAARAMGINEPKVSILDANEVPSPNVPSTIMAQKVASLHVDNCIIEGPLSYDLSLYEDAVRKKRLRKSKVAGKADILVVPRIEGGNFIYKSWVMTSGAEVANIVMGAKVPIILTSRSDNESTKFLNICAGVLNSEFIKKSPKG